MGRNNGKIMEDNGKEKNLSSTTFVPNIVYSCLLGKKRRDYSISFETVY